MSRKKKAGTQASAEDASTDRPEHPGLVTGADGATNGRAATPPKPRRGKAAASAQKLAAEDTPPVIAGAGGTSSAARPRSSPALLEGGVTDIGIDANDASIAAQLRASSALFPPTGGIQPANAGGTKRMQQQERAQAPAGDGQQPKKKKQKGKGGGGTYWGGAKQWCFKRRSVIWYVTTTTMLLAAAWFALIQQEPDGSLSVVTPTAINEHLVNLTSSLSEIVTDWAAASSLQFSNINAGAMEMLTEWWQNKDDLATRLNMTVAEVAVKLLAQFPSLPSLQSPETAPTPSTSRPGLKLATQGYKVKFPVVIIPGFVTSQLEMWQGHPCAAKYFRQRMWGTMGMMQAFLLNKPCWFAHLELDPVTGLDPPGIKLRAAQGMEAIDFFVQGYWVWNRLIEALADVGYTPNTLTTLSFDWRLSIPNMETRDAWFTHAKKSIEVMAEVNGEKCVLASHSYGENVARTLLHWAEAQTPGWVEKYVEAHVSISGPTLGAPKAITALMSGEARDTAQMGTMASYLADSLMPRPQRARLFRSWGSLIAMFPAGGPKVWGNGTWAPDDTPALRAANKTYGAMVVSTPLRPAAAAAAAAVTAGGQRSPRREKPCTCECSDRDSGDGMATSDKTCSSDDDESQGSDGGGEHGNAGQKKSCTCGCRDRSDDINKLANKAVDMEKDKGQAKGDGETSGGPDSANTTSDKRSEAAEKLGSKTSGSAVDEDEAAVGGFPSGIASTVLGWFQASDETSASDLLDTSKLQRMTVDKAIKVALQAAGPTRLEQYRQWGPVAGVGLKNVHKSDKSRGVAYPNPLIAPLPNAPSFKLYCLYGVGVPTERAYHYVQPQGWKPPEDLPAGPDTADPFAMDRDRDTFLEGERAAKMAAGLDTTYAKEQCEEAVSEGKPGPNVTEVEEAAAGRKAASDATDVTEAGSIVRGKEADGGNRTVNSTEGTYEWRINTAIDDEEAGLDNGIQMGEGDLTIPLISLGAMCQGGWRSKRLNPAQHKVVSREYKHAPVSVLQDPRGGPSASSHIDILGNEELLNDVLLVAVGAGHLVEQRLVSNIEEIAANIPWEDKDGWE